MRNTALQSRTFSATDALRGAILALQRARIETASLDARLLLQHVLGVSREQLLAGAGFSLDAEQDAAFQALIEKRAKRQPVAQLIGRREFWELTFKVTGATLDPRPDSETLIEAVLARVRDWNAALKVLDLGTGSGCLLLTLLNVLKNAQGLGVDISEDALKIAQENAKDLGFQGRADFIKSCWGDKVNEGEKFDIVISNPPYIPTGSIAGLAPEVRQYEPMLALDGGADGLDCYRALIGQLPGLLAENGLAVLEIGMGQEKDVSAIIAGNGLQVADIKKDMAGIARCIVVTH